MLKLRAVGRSFAATLLLLATVSASASLYGGNGDDVADANQGAKSGSGTVTAGASQPTQKERLEIQKLELEIQTLRRWWTPYLPAAFAAIAVVVAFLTAWLTGVFEARNNKLQADNTLLQYKSEAYKADVTTFEEQKLRLTGEMELLREKNAALEHQNVELEARIGEAQTALRTADVAVFAKKLELEGLSQSTALDDLVAALKAENDDEAAHLVRQRADETASGEAGPWLRYALYLGTLDAKWLESLLDDVRRIGNGPVGESLDATIDVLGDRRWPDADRPAIAAVLSSASANKGLPSDLRIKCLRAIGRLHVVTKWNYDGASPTTKYRIDLTDFDAFAEAVIAARDLVLDASLMDYARGLALWGLARFSPPALLATAAQLMSQLDFSDYEAARAHNGLSRPLQEAVDYANSNASFHMMGPRSPQPYENSLEEYASTASAWARWRTDHPDLLTIWMEADLATLRANQIKYAAMFDPYH